MKFKAAMKFAANALWIRFAQMPLLILFADARLARKTINLRSLPRDKIQSSMGRPNAPRYFASFRTEISCLTPFYAARFLKFRRLARSGDEADLCGFGLERLVARFVARLSELG